jgi:hypothetical protein
MRSYPLGQMMIKERSNTHGPSPSTGQVSWTQKVPGCIRPFPFSRTTKVSGMGNTDLPRNPTMERLCRRSATWLTDNVMYRLGENSIVNPWK